MRTQETSRLAVWCGIAAALLYVVLNVASPALYPGYSSVSQAISELSAIGAPTRPFWLVLGTLYSLLVVAFGWGLWASAGSRRWLKATGALTMANGLIGVYWPPMHQRGTEFTLTDTLHIAWMAVTGLLMLLAIGFAAASLSRSFRLYSLATLAVMLVTGFVTSVAAPDIRAGLPTPWIGVWERASAGAFMLWMVVLALLLLREPQWSKGRKPRRPEVHGYVAPGFEAVRKAFEENFTLRNELGGACCIYQYGEKVVDLWGGVRNQATGELWEEDTMVVVFSATKGMAAMALALAHSRGLLDYDERVCTYWPEFAQQGKEKMTVRQLLAHQGGLFAFHEKVDRDLIADVDRLAVVLARQAPEHIPGERQAYHAMTLGFYESELLRRIDTRHRSLGQFFQDEIATPLELEFYIRLPEWIPDRRLAVLDKGSPLSALISLPPSLRFAAINPGSEIFRALMVNPGSWVSLDEKRVYARNLEVPSGGGVGTARAIARAYSAFATGGHELRLAQETLRELTAPAVPPTYGFFDLALRGEVQFSLGFMKPCENWPFGHEGAFGSPGAGGSLGYADPKTGIAYAYVTNRLGTVDGDPRDVALRAAIPSEPAVAGVR